MTGEEAGRLWDLPDGLRLFEYLGGISGLTPALSGIYLDIPAERS